MVQGVSIFLLVQILLTQTTHAVDKAPLYSWYEGLDNNNVVIAINCGAEEDSVDQAGIHYKADQNYQGGITSNEGGN